MNDKTCGDCRKFKNIRCGHCEENHPACIAFEAKLTNGDRIRQMSNEELAESSVYFEEEHTIGSACGVTFSGGWTSPFIEYKYGTKSEAIATTVKKLKEVYNG